jgi:predicted ATP-dependent serine protease
MNAKKKELPYPCTECNHQNKEYCGKRNECRPWVGWVTQEWRKIQETFKRKGTDGKNRENSNG